MAASKNSGLCDQKDAGSSIARWDVSVSNDQTKCPEAITTTNPPIYTQHTLYVRSKYSVYQIDPDHDADPSTVISVPKSVTDQTVLKVDF